MKILYAVMTSVLFISSLSVASASEPQEKSKEEIRAEREKLRLEKEAVEKERLEKAEKEMAVQKEKITARCPQEIPMAKMMEIKNKGSTEIEGHHYYPYKTEEFNKNAPGSVQLLTQREIAKFTQKAIGDKGVWVCSYTYTTFAGYSYVLDIVDAGPRIK